MFVLQGPKPRGLDSLEDGRSLGACSEQQKHLPRRPATWDEPTFTIETATPVLQDKESHCLIMSPSALRVVQLEGQYKTFTVRQLWNTNMVERAPWLVTSLHLAYGLPTSSSSIRIEKIRKMKAPYFAGKAMNMAEGEGNEVLGDGKTIADSSQLPLHDASTMEKVPHYPRYL